MQRKEVEMASTLDQSSRSYCRLVNHLARGSPGLQALHDFVNATQYPPQNPAKFTIININPSNMSRDASPTIEFTEFDGTDKLAQALCSATEPDTRCRLFVVENVCPHAVALLGGCFDIDPQFFADHLNNASWYRIENIPDRLPALPSSQKTHDFLQLRCIDIRTIERVQSQSSNFPSDIEDAGSSKSGSSSFSDPTSDARRVMYPDITTTRIQRKAGTFISRSREGKKSLLLCTRQVTTVWFRKRNAVGEGWIGMTNFMWTRSYQ
jgi:hypothetical protein